MASHRGGRQGDHEHGGRSGAFPRRSFLKGAAASAGVVSLNLGTMACEGAPVPNAVSDENLLPGVPSSEWDSYESTTIEGFATRVSVNAGETVQFKVATASTDYRIRIYRMGWYQGLGARRVAEFGPSATLPQAQPDPLTDADFPGQPATGLVDCGNWAVSASWTVPADAVSGVYFAKFDRLDVPGLTNRAFFVVRNDGRATDLLVQTSDTTMHAYNRWGGNSLYYSLTLGRAHKVSYNRPFRIDGFGNAFWDAEYPLVRWLERNGYDVAYTTGVDTDARGAELLNHKVFVSSGHDEYWSSAQRANVEAARDAGVHLVFMAGNEVFWKIRWEDSVDGTGTPRRTMVCYKETLEGAKLDPTPEWTGTWRDPRFSPPSDGGRPELPLIGQIFGAINDPGQPDLTIRVPAHFGDLRFWRDTDVATSAPGTTIELTEGTLGYEWDDDRDLGPKPAGLLELSATTETVPAVLIDNGKGYAAQAANHRLTLYRAASGALVWGTGTCQWSWGLDETHPRPAGPPQDRMRQATANMLADMGARPVTPQSGLVPPTASTDLVAPSSTVTSPAGGSWVPVGSPVMVTGTAADVGGVVAAVEVSVDGGASWERAAGTDTWSHQFIPAALGPVSLRSRAVDDSVNTETPGPGASITVTERDFPASIWHASETPVSPSISDANPIEVGLRFRTVEEGFVTGVRFYKGDGNTGPHIGHLWTATGQQLAEVTFVGESEAGWQQAMFPTPVAVSTGTTYVISYFAPAGHYAADSAYFASAHEVWPLRALADGEDGPNGRFRYGSTGFPGTSFNATNYWVDVVFDIDDRRAPTVVDLMPAPGLDAVALGTTPSVRFSEAMNATSIVMQVTGPGGATVAGVTSYQASTRRATFTPTAPLAPSTAYTARVVQARDRSGESLAAPVDWPFVTVGGPDSYPLTFWDSAATLVTASVADTQPIEVGVKFRSDVAGVVKGVRFHKGPANGGGHPVHLWTLGGELLGTATPAVESETGWQQANFEVPVPINGGETYVASYYAPVGGYSASPAMFATGVDRGVLHIPASGASGGNGVFRYGTSGLPTQPHNRTNYGVDVVFLLPPDVAGPSVVDHAPAPDVVSVVVGTEVRATFSEAIAPSSLSFGLTGPGGAVPASVSYDGPSRRATLTPSAPLGAAGTYTATVSATDTGGNAMAAPYSWSFRTLGPAGTSPATIWNSATVPATPASGDTGAIEVGLKFRAGSDGHVTGIRFYKGQGNVGSHVGTVWRADGTPLGSVPFTTETATGWQQADLATPVPVVAGQTYVVSYHAPNGRYGVTSGLFSSAGVERPPLHALRSGVDGPNGVYRYGAHAFPTSGFNHAWYGVDVVFADTTGPSVVAHTPAADATGVARDAQLTVTFREPVNTADLSVTLVDTATDEPVAGTWGYDAGTRTVTLAHPLLDAGRTYAASVDGARDSVGNAMAGARSWSFTTVSSGVVSLWPSTAGPAVAAANDAASIEVGTKFRVDAPGVVVAVRFYKGPGNTGTHRGRVWRADGTLLGQVTFTGETATGWQQANLATPLALVPGTTYVVSYHAPVGRYSSDAGYFAAAGVDSGVLHALAHGVDGGNGVYLYGPAGGFPTSSTNAVNYWVDIAFQEGT